MMQMYVTFPRDYSPIGLCAMYDFHDKDNQTLVLKLAQYAIVADPIAPQTLQRTYKCMAVKLWVIERSDLFLEVVRDPALPLTVKLA